MNGNSTFIENYKEYLFYLYYLGQINRKKNISLITQSEFDKISVETKRKLQFSFNLLNRATLELSCSKCDKKIKKQSFIVCDLCYEIFHEHHIKPEKQIVKCVNCNNRLKKIKIFDNEIYLSSERINKNEIDISKIEIHF